LARAELPRIQLEDTWPSAYELRRARAGVCTFEATALALGLLENLSLARTLLTRFAEWARRADWLKAGGHPERAPSALLEWERQLAVHPATPHLDLLGASTSPSFSSQ
jgi:DTW domain-containing protein YfiP